VPLAATLVLLVMLVALIGFYGASVAGRELRLPSLVIPGWMPGPSVAPTLPQSVDEAVLLGPDADQQRYLDALLPIHSRLMQTVMRTGLAAAAYGERDSDPAYFRSQIDDSLASYRRVEEDVLALKPPPGLRSSHDSYLAAVRLFERSAVEMRKVYDDGDPKGNACGTRGCAAGLIVLVGSDPDEEFTDTSHVTVNGRTNRMSVSDRATQLAELSYEQREWLFSAVRSRDEVIQALDALIADPDAAVWEIEGEPDEDEDDGEEIPVPFTVQIVDASGSVVWEHGVMSPASETYDELILRLGEDL